MIPLTIKQQKFSKMSSIMQPELKKIQDKYKGKKDQASMQKMQLEQSALYQKYGVSPTAGCLPLLISLPIMLAMYRVIQNVPAYVPAVKGYYRDIAEAIRATDAPYLDTMKEMAKVANVSTSNFGEMSDGIMSVNHMIDVFNGFKTHQWAELASAFSQYPEVVQIIQERSSTITHVNSLFGTLNLANVPGLAFPGVIIPILAVVSQWLQTKLMQVSNKVDKNDPTQNAMKSMGTIMPLFSGFLCVMMPIGLGIYWVASSVFGIVSQFFVNKYLDKMDVDELVEKSKEKADKKHAKSGGMNGKLLQQLANTQTKNIEGAQEASDTKSMKSIAKMSSNKENTTNNNASEVSYTDGSISGYANLLKNRNNDKGEK